MIIVIVQRHLLGSKTMWRRLFTFIDWFIPQEVKQEQSDRNLARVFVFTHLAGPLLAQAMSVVLYMSDPNPGFACWTIIVSTWLFWLLPFVFRATKNLQLVALLSVELLAFASLLGSYFYGGVSSPFLPWVVVAVFLGFFYLAERPFLIIGSFATKFLLFAVAYVIYGFPERIPLEELATLGWVSIFSATIYMSWIAVYYSIMMATRSELEREARRHKDTAERLREAKELADMASHATSIFLAKMSHELRTPLNAVMGFSELLLENELKRGNQATIADLQKINAAGRHLTALFTDVLDLSKIETDRLDLTIREFDLSKFVDEIVETVKPLVNEKQNTFVLDIPAEVGTIATDETKLRQIVLNLLSNASKFTSDGTITMTVLRNQRQSSDWIEIHVQDTGVGIAPADIPKLFHKYAQATVSTSRTYGGTGLGLALSQKLCGLLGGAITCESELGTGSRFTIRVPATLTQDIPSESDARPYAISAQMSASPA